MFEVQHYSRFWQFDRRESSGVTGTVGVYQIHSKPWLPWYKKREVISVSTIYQQVALPWVQSFSSHNITELIWDKLHTYGSESKLLYLYKIIRYIISQGWIATGTPERASDGWYQHPHSRGCSPPDGGVVADAIAGHLFTSVLRAEIHAGGS